MKVLASAQIVLEDEPILRLVIDGASVDYSLRRSLLLLLAKQALEAYLWTQSSIWPTSSERVMSRRAAISFSVVQNSSSRLTLVLWPRITIDRFITVDVIAHIPLQNCGELGAHLL
jgi:hypothetical protein